MSHPALIISYVINGIITRRVSARRLFWVIRELQAVT
jgi:hypothetical protein